MGIKTPTCAAFALACIGLCAVAAADSSSGVAQPASYNTSDLETWLETSSNLDAIQAFCWAEQYEADEDFQPLDVDVSGDVAAFVFTAQDSGTSSSVAVTVVGANDLAEDFTEDALTASDTEDGVTTYVSTDSDATSCFAKLLFSKGW